MQFCEKCNLLTDGKRCPSCRNKKLRDVHDDDFYYFTDLHSMCFEMFEEALKNNNIDVVGVPYYPGNAVVFSNAGRADGRKVYVRYKNLDTAAEIYNALFNRNSD